MRYERKYKISDINHHVLLQAIRLHPATLRTIYPDRQINNIYFDTMNLQCYNDNVNGISERKKYRVRWYGEDVFDIKNPNLEIKYRLSEVGSKDILPVPEFDLQNLRGLTETVHQTLNKKVTLRPVLMNSYMRSYFGTKDGKYRITIDRKLQFFSLLSSNRFVRYITKEDAVIMELKYETADDVTTDRITQHFPLRQTKSSKYVTGVQLTNWL
jgi:SPX domain protein involved in polyphosphate accumulation